MFIYQRGLQIEPNSVGIENIDFAAFNYEVNNVCFFISIEIRSQIVRNNLRQEKLQIISEFVALLFTDDAIKFGINSDALENVNGILVLLQQLDQSIHGSVIFIYLLFLQLPQILLDFRNHALFFWRFAQKAAENIGK